MATLHKGDNDDDDDDDDDNDNLIYCPDKWVPVTTEGRVLRLRMEERPPNTECSCKCIE